MSEISSADLSTRIYDTMSKVPDFPKKGILFYDFTPVLLDKILFANIIHALSQVPVEFDLIAGLDARGFLLASAVAYQSELGLLAVRKQGKLPPPVLSERYNLEYGTNTLEIPGNLTTIRGAHVLIIDDVLATGGTAAATKHLLERAGATVVGLAVVMELEKLQGREHCHLPVWSLCRV